MWKEKSIDMQSFDEFKISNQLQYAIEDLGFENPTPIQEKAFPVVMSGKDVIGIAQTGTGKTFAYMLPILQGLSSCTGNGSNKRTCGTSGRRDC